LLLSGCGKPTASGGGGGDFPVSAVVAPVSVEELQEKIFLVGSLEAVEEIELVSEIDARVDAINFEEGEPVKKGTVLIQLDDRKLQAETSEMRARFNLAKANLERSETLLQRETISQQDYDQAEAEFDAAKALLQLAEERLEDATISAPFDGVMTERLVSLGQYTSRGQPLASLVVVDPLEVEFNVPERYIGQLGMDQEIEITVEAFPGELFTGNVIFISPRVDRNTRTVLVKARINNDDRRLKPGMFGNLELIFKARDAALVIPEAAISYNSDQASVVVMNAEGKAEFRQVEVGIRLAGKAEIIDGLADGERVVVEGFQKMRPGSTIQISIESREYGIDPAAANGSSGTDNG
jgi:membrane fusion protein (multidrug efflux system)